MGYRLVVFWSERSTSCSLIAFEIAKHMVGRYGARTDAAQAVTIRWKCILGPMPIRDAECCDGAVRNLIQIDERDVLSIAHIVSLPR